MVALVWAVAVLAPDLLTAGRLSGGRPALSTYLLAAAGSLSLWLGCIAWLGALRARRPRLASAVLALGAVVAPLAVVCTLRYRQALHVDPLPSTVAFFLRNPGYGLALAREGATRGDCAGLLLGPLLVGGLLWALSRPARPGPDRPRAALLGVALGSLALLLGERGPADLVGLRSLLGGIPLAVVLPWRSWVTPTDRVALAPAVPAAAPDIVLIVHESLSARRWAPWDPRAPVTALDAFLRAHGDHAAWLPLAAPPAPSTAVSLPSLLTGLEPDASAHDLSRAPLLWQEAAALGYQTALLSPQDYDWAGFPRFFLGREAPQVHRVATDFPGAPRVNDHGVEDRRVVAAAAELLASGRRPQLLVLQLNATHGPCYAPGFDNTGLAHGDMDGRGGPGPRCAAAIAYVAELTAELLRQLERLGRLEQTLVIGTADHGESFDPSRPTRLESFYEDTLNVPLWLHLPRAFAHEHPGALAALRGNAALRASNLDIYPTVLDLWGRWPTSGDRPRLGGESLLRPLPRDRELLLLNSNELHYWSRQGFALYQGPWKWSATDGDALRLYDLSRDPEERENLAAAAPPHARALLRRAACRSTRVRRVLWKLGEQVRGCGD